MPATRRRPIEPELGGGAFGFLESVMAGLPWIKVWTVIGDHPKLQRLEKELGIVDGLGVVIRLWCWTAEYHPDGEIPVADGPALGRAARGPLSRVTVTRVTRACVTAGLLDQISSGFRVHDWSEMQTTHVEADEKRKAQARERQAKHRAKRTAGHGDITRDVTRDSVTEKEKETERTTYTLGRASGEADRTAIDAKHDDPAHPLLDAVVLALRAAGLKPQYPKNGMRASVEAAIEAVSVPVATERIVNGWVVSKPWLSYYLDKIAPPPPEVRRRAVVLPPADGWEPAPGPPPDESVPLFPDRP